MGARYIYAEALVCHESLLMAASWHAMVLHGVPGKFKIVIHPPKMYAPCGAAFVCMRGAEWPRLACIQALLLKVG